MQPPLPSATASWHNDTYAAIAPERPELSARGKTVIIVGAGSGIGQETARAFSAAGASKIALVGRTQATLIQTTTALSSPNSVHVADVADEKALQAVAASVGQWDVLILAAGFTTSPAPVVQTPINEWWQAFETNVKGTVLAVQAFAPTANPTHAAILGVTSGATAMPAAVVPGLSAYMSSKLAQTKVLEHVAAELPNVYCATVHPGMIETAIFTKSGSKAERLPMDTIQLPAHFMVWLVSPEGAFLRGRSVWANWDVEELKSQAQDIQAGLKMTSGINGWPY